jgi:hypothetical protein
MVRVGSVMAMALVAERPTLEPEAEEDDAEKADLDNLGAIHLNMGTLVNELIKGGLGLVFVTVPFTPGLTLTMGHAEGTFDMFVSRLARAGLAVGGSLSCPSRRHLAAVRKGTGVNSNLTIGIVRINGKAFTITTSIAVAWYVMTDVTMTPSRTTMAMIWGGKVAGRGAAAATPPRQEFLGTKSDDDLCILALTSPEPLRRRRRACTPVTRSKPRRPKSVVKSLGDVMTWDGMAIYSDIPVIFITIVIGATFRKEAHMTGMIGLRNLAADHDGCRKNTSAATSRGLAWS